MLQVSFPQDIDEGGTGGDAEQDSQDPPHSDAVPLLLEQRFVVQPGEEVMKVLLGRLEFDQVVIQDQLSHTCHAFSQPQHLLSFMDALGSFPTNEVANNTGQRLNSGVEVLVGSLQIQLCSI